MASSLVQIIETYGDSIPDPRTLLDQLLPALPTDQARNFVIEALEYEQEHGEKAADHDVFGKAVAGLGRVLAEERLAEIHAAIDRAVQEGDARMEAELLAEEKAVKRRLSQAS